RWPLAGTVSGTHGKEANLALAREGLEREGADGGADRVVDHRAHDVAVWRGLGGSVAGPVRDRALGESELLLARVLLGLAAAGKVLAAEADRLVRLGAHHAAVGGFGRGLLLAQALHGDVELGLERACLLLKQALCSA